jgi:DNA-directed RNA polymerase subunit H (RpoH/RPB5)
MKNGWSNPESPLEAHRLLTEEEQEYLLERFKMNSCKQLPEFQIHKPPFCQ